MMLIETTGDLFEGDRKAIAHGVNCCGVMGAGVAGILRSIYPNMYGTYYRLCNSDEGLHPGDIFPWIIPSGGIIYNLATQYLPGADARLEAIEMSARKMLTDAIRRQIWRVSMPRIGCGIGGLQWDDVRAVLDRASKDNPVEIEVVTLS